MGIRQFGHVKFDGVDLADFGVTLSGTGTYNAPERDVTSISVPGRNGDILIDNGRYFNIEVEYPVNIELGLPDKVPALRAFLMSHKGYFRLEDSYHPDEFRLAQYAGPFEINPTGSHNRYGRMVLTFNCKPQRYLKAGERVALTVEGTTSPTSLVTEGIADNICSSAFKSAFTSYSSIAREHITVIDWTDYIGTSAVLELYYGDDMMAFGSGDNPASNSYASGTNSTAPVTKDRLSFAVSPAPCDYFISPTADHPYVWFTTPNRWEIVSGGFTVVDSGLPDHGVIVNPTMFEASPLLHITLPLNHVMDDKPVALVNNSQIRMTFDGNYVTIGAFSVRLTDMYIDCASMDAYVNLGDPNAYIYVGNLMYSLNGNVTLPDNAITLKPGENDIYINSAIESIEIIPNWWRL